jgi:hypothetical protein
MLGEFAAVRLLLFVRLTLHLGSNQQLQADTLRDQTIDRRGRRRRRRRRRRRYGHLDIV